MEKSKQLSSISCPICLSTENVPFRPYRSKQKPFSEISILKCSNCSGCFAYPFPSNHVLERYYKFNYRSNESPRRLKKEPTPWGGGLTRARSQFDFVIRNIHNIYKEKINSWLDIGSGYGWLLDEVKKNGVQKTGAIELDENCCDRLKQHCHILKSCI